MKSQKSLSTLLISLLFVLLFAACQEQERPLPPPVVVIDASPTLEAVSFDPTDPTDATEAIEPAKTIHVTRVTATPQPTLVLPTTPEPAAYSENEIQTISHNEQSAPDLEQIRILKRDAEAESLTPSIVLTLNLSLPIELFDEGLMVDPPSVGYDISLDGPSVTIEITEPLLPGDEVDFYLSSAVLADAGYRFPTNNPLWTAAAAEAIARLTGPTTSDPMAPIEFHFNYPIDYQTFSQLLEIEPAIDGRFVWSPGYEGVKLIPNGSLSSQTLYTFRFSDTLRDIEGNTLGQPDARTLKSPFVVASHRPSVNDNRVSVFNPIKVIFNQPMDPATAKAAFEISPAVAGEITVEENVLTFTPTHYFSEFETYLVTIDPTALNQAKDAVLEDPYTWSFSTGHFDADYSFGSGANVQVIDMDGRRAIHLMPNADGPRTFDLYRLELASFAEQYGRFYDSTRWRMIQPKAATERFPLVTSWTEEKPEDGDWRETFVPADVPPGLYWLNLSTDRLNSQIMLVVSNQTLVVKAGEDQVTVWLSDLNGNSIEGGEIFLFDREGNVILTGRTDTNGVFKSDVGRDMLPYLVAGRTGEDVVISGLEWAWKSQGSDSWWWWRSGRSALGGNPLAELYSITDRPIYRPGDTVNFKTIARLQDDALFDLPSGEQTVDIRVLDPRDNLLQSYTLAPNEFGTVNDSFNIEEGVTLGHFTLEASLLGRVHELKFQVEDYRKPDFELEIETDSAYYFPGDTIEVKIDSRYFFGEPVVDAAVTVKRYDLVSNWYSADGDYHWEGGAGGANQGFNGRTDENGQLTITVPVRTDFNFGDDYYYSFYHRHLGLRSAKWGIEATINDGSNQTVSSFAMVDIYEAAEGVSLERFSYLQRPNEPFEVRGQLLHVNGAPVVGKRVELLARQYNYRSDDSRDVVKTVSLITDANGRIATSFLVEENGFYEFEVLGRDDAGRDFKFKRFLYVVDRNYAWNREESGLRITASEEVYTPGDTAQLIVESPVTGPALLTVERGTTRREMMVELTGPLTVLDLPIEPTDAPNIYASISVWQAEDTVLTNDQYFSKPDGKLIHARVNLSVPATDKLLNVEIVPDKERYAPGEEATFTLRVTNFKGDPVSAELSLALVDEAIFALKEEQSEPIFDGFYYERKHGIDTYHSFGPIRYIGPGGGMGGGGGGIGPANPRADFPDTAVWLPVLRTDFKGEVVVPVTLPDNLTSWRVTVKATTADTQVGEAIGNVTTWQPVIVRPLLPRQLTAGDRVELSAIVHNYDSEAVTVDVALVLEGDAAPTIVEEGGTTQTVTIAPGGTQVVGWPLSADAGTSGEVILTLSATPRAAGKWGDAIQLPLTVQPLAIREVRSDVGQFRSSVETVVTLPADALSEGVVEIELAQTIAGTLLQGLDDLTGYPYGCVEQTMSRALPNAVIGRALNQLGLTIPGLDGVLDEQIRAGVHKLLGFQHYDGGWGWWYSDPSDDYQTAWVLYGLAQMVEAGHEVDPKVLEEGAAYLNENLSGMDPRTQAFALFALAEAGYANGDANRLLAVELNQLQGDIFSLAALALALDPAEDGETVDLILDMLADAAVRTESGVVYWEGANQDGYYAKKTMASDVRSTALALSAFARLRPDDPDDFQLTIVNWLMRQRGSFGWGTTNETSFAIMGLTDYLLAAQIRNGSRNTSYEVWVNGEPYDSGLLNAGTPQVTLEIRHSDLIRGENRIELRQDGDRPIYFGVHNRLLLAREEIEARGVIGIERRYIDVESGDEINQVIAGQLVRVELYVEMPEIGTYMIVEDKLPSGFEALNEGLNTTSHEYAQYGNPDARPRYNYSYKEIFGDRVSFFSNELKAGQTVYSYLVRATMSGEFIAMPAEAYAMYETELWGRSGSELVVIDAEPVE